MKKLLVILISVLSLNTGAAEFNLQEIKDEFTDQRIATMLTINNDAMLGAVAFRCDDTMFALTLAQPGFYKTEDWPLFSLSGCYARKPTLLKHS